MSYSFSSFINILNYILSLTSEDMLGELDTDIVTTNEDW